MDILLDYIRMVSYALIILASLRGIFVRKFTNILFLGDIVIALALFVLLIFSTVFKYNLATSADILMTPAAVIWAIIHYWEFIQTK